MAVGMQIRRRVVAALERGESGVSIARRLEIGERTVRRLRKCWAAGESLEPRKSGSSRHRKLTEADLALLGREVAADPGVTLAELRGRLSVTVAESTVSRALKKLGLSYKKSR
ncbi:MAG: helix-turn-helix domain-containing protein [Planctomycetota bacterium]